MSIEGQGHFFTIYFQVLYVLCFSRPRYQVSVYRTFGPLVLNCFYSIIFILAGNEEMHKILKKFEHRPDPTID